MLQLIEKSSQPAITLDELKVHLRREDTTDDDGYITACAQAATDWAERFTGLALVDQTWDLFLDDFPSGAIYLKRLPIIEVVDAFYRDTTEISFSTYLFDASAGRIFLAANALWPTTDGAMNAVRIRFRAGYIDLAGSPTGEVPFAIKAAIKIYAATLYAQREDDPPAALSVKTPWGAEALLRNYRVDDSLA